MDSGQHWSNSSSRTPTDSGPSSNQGYQRAFDSYLYKHLLRRNLQTTAQTFKEEAQVADVVNASVSDTQGDFLYDWWNLFYETLTARENGREGNQTALYPQVGQTSSMYDLPPLPPALLQEPSPIQFVSSAGFIPQSWPAIFESSTWVAGTCSNPLAQAVPNGSLLVSGLDDVPPVYSALNGSVQFNSANAAPTGWWAHEGAVVPANEQAPMPLNAVLNLQSPGSSSKAVVLTPWNVNSARPAQPCHLRRGIRLGGTLNDPIDIEVPVASSVPGGRRPGRQAQPVSGGSSSGDASVRPPALSVPPPGFVGMSPGQRLGRMARLSRTRPFPALRNNSALTLGPGVNSNGASGSLARSSSLGLVGQVESYGPLQNTYSGMLSSAPIRNFDAQNSANRTVVFSSGSSYITQFGQGLAGWTSPQNSIPMVSGKSDVLNPLWQGMSSVKYTDGMNTEALGQSSATPAIVSHGTQEPRNPETYSGAKKHKGVSSARQDSNMEETEDKDKEEHREDDNIVVGEYLNANYGPELEADSVGPPRKRPHPQQQSSHLTQVRDLGFEFKQEACLESNLSEIWCCHFSSDGMYLACAGVDRKVIVWNMSKYQFTASEEHHDGPITDIRFKPNSTIFASASLDKTIWIWDATKLEKPLAHLIGHATKVTSLDFHPAKDDILCSSDVAMEIRFWNLSNQTCIHATKGASQQVRFQPQKGRYLAAVAGNTINILDSETCTIMHCLKRHIQPVECLDWDSCGRYIVSACQESVNIWSVASWCTNTHKLMAVNGGNFKSCIFHPRISHVVIIGTDKNIEIWNPMVSSRTLVVPAHESHVAGLTTSICTDIIASASHDGRMKLWK